MTDRQRLAPRVSLDVQIERLVSQVAAAARAGVGLVHVRERDLEARALVSLVRRLRDAVQGTPTRIVVNDRVDIARAAGADGVHLRGDSYSAARARAVLPDDAVIGRSIHTAAEAAGAGDGVDYLVFGTVYASASKPSARPAGLTPLTAAVARANVPVLAIGGVTIARLRDIAGSGAAGVAAIELFLPPEPGAPDRPGIVESVAAIRAAFAGGIG